MKTKCKRSLSMLMAVLLCFSAFMGIGTTTAFAASETDEVLLISYPRDGDANLDYSGTWGHGNLQYMNGWSSGSSIYTTVRAMGSYEGNICYCIEPGVPLDNGDVLTKWGEDFWENYPSDYNKTIAPYEIKAFIGRIMQYGYTGNISTSWKSQNEGGDKLAYAAATQLLIWETVVGERDSDFNHVDTGSYDAVADQISNAHPLRAKIISYYSSIESSVQEHSKLPSFMSKTAGRAQSIELAWNGSEYTATLTDTNNVLGNYSFSGNGLSFSVSGNKLTITAKTAPASAVSITAEKKNSQRRGIITWTDGHYLPGHSTLQDVITYAESVSDPVKGFLNVKVSYGSAKIVKTSEDGKVDGINFHVQGNGIDKTVQTKNGGQIQIDNLMPGVYTVTELTEDRYEPQETRRVTVVSGQTSTVTFNNILKRGDLTVTKTSEDGLNEGVKFHLSGTSYSGLAVDEYAVTDNTGKAYFRDVLIGSGYVLEEMDTAIRYVVPDKQTAAIEWNKVTEKSFDNILKKWQLTVTKSDSEAGTAQGDASLAGAEYGIFKGDQLIDTYTTDTNGQFITEYYICDSDWSLRELNPSEGYLLNGDTQHIGVEPKLYEVEYNSAALDALETVTTGKIAVIKHCDDGETQIETPEAGAEFEVFLKASGSYENAKESECDYLVCDENGFAETKLLPYGIYTVRQTKGWDGNELMKPFDVFIRDDGGVYRYLINNATFESFIKVIKTDSTTGKVIPYAGAGFQIYDPSGSLVTMTYTYPEIITIDTFYTTDEGMLITPEKLPYGLGYTLVEVSAPYGYVLDSTPVTFDVTEDNSTEESAVTIIKVEKQNAPQMGTITVSKSGEVFSSVTEADGLYQPVYASAWLAGAVYEITAAEDIITPDGTLRYSKGEVAATIETDSTGAATTVPLYLGSYEIREVKAPYGMVLNPERKSVQLTYAGQEINITETAASFYNERQRVQINLSKIMEQDERFQIGMNGEILTVQFGLFAAEDLTAADGSVIPADGLMEIVSCDENGKAAFASDIPVGAKLYVKEIAVDSHYMLSNEKYPVEFVYAGQDVGTVTLSANDGEPIENDIIYGTIKGLKIDRETEDSIAGTIFGLFHADEAEYTEETAILTA